MIGAIAGLCFVAGSAFGCWAGYRIGKHETASKMRHMIQAHTTQMEGQVQAMCEHMQTVLRGRA